MCGPCSGNSPAYLHADERLVDDEESDEHNNILELREHFDESGDDLSQPVPHSHQPQRPARDNAATLINALVRERRESPTGPSGTRPAQKGARRAYCILT
jgi:hypothetical protein|eukprot:3621419-Prymnesium_polylepis.4